MLVEGSEKKSLSESESEGGRIPAAITDTGCERELNEDRYAVVEAPSGVAWLVCDGMGGVTGGELAAQLAIDSIRRDLENLPARPSEVALRAAILEANRVIVLRRQNPVFAGMGTTIVSALFQGPEIAITHVGDSRAYLVREGAIQQLTTDHTYVQELVDRGEINLEEALTHPQAHILTRCIGAEPGLEVDVKKFWVWDVSDAEPTDYLMLCTDGLYSLVSEGEMASVISEHSPQRACIHLVELAKSRGGYDNITLAIIPLGGQLRQEPPIGFQPHALLRAAQRAEKRERVAQVAKRDPVNVVALILFWLAGSAVMVAAVFLFMTFWVGR
jgi:PPM family protein phosphatase